METLNRKVTQYALKTQQDSKTALECIIVTNIEETTLSVNQGAGLA